MRYHLRTLLIFVVAITLGLCEAALIIGMFSRSSDPRSPLFIAGVISVSLLLGGASGWLFSAMGKWAKSK